jgi:bifunctional non-homologous end joining protein LigD/DNA ligase-1
MILDGELIALTGGKPDFQEAQRRSLMTNPFKIGIASKKCPVSFMAYDVLYIGSKSVTDQPLEWRVDALAELVAESPSLALSRRTPHEGIALFEAARAQGLEGIVAKRKDSLYCPGKRSKDWIKMKNLMDEDFIVCGYYRKDGSVASVIIGGYKNGKIVYQGYVALGVSRHDFNLMEQCEKADASEFYRDFPDFPGVAWLVPRIVCTVQYMERTKHGGLRQPVFKGVRLDKTPEDCVI